MHYVFNNEQNAVKWFTNVKENIPAILILVLAHMKQTDGIQTTFIVMLFIVCTDNEVC